MDTVVLPLSRLQQEATDILKINPLDTVDNDLYTQKKKRKKKNSKVANTSVNIHTYKHAIKYMKKKYSPFT